MKIVLNILKFIFTIALASCIIAITFIFTIDNTILNKEYVLNKLEETNYYANTYYKKQLE